VRAWQGQYGSGGCEGLGLVLGGSSVWGDGMRECDGGCGVVGVYGP
jgi:hypothetical protein